MGENLPLLWGGDPWLEGVQGDTFKDMKSLSPCQSPLVPTGRGGPHNAVDHQLCPSVSSETTTLGLTPEETCLVVLAAHAGCPSPQSWYGHSSPASGAMLRKGRETLKNLVSTTRVTMEREKTPSVREAVGQARC